MSENIAFILTTTATLSVCFFVVGFITPKFFVFGGAHMALFWVGAPLAPHVTRADVEALIPPLLGTLTIFPDTFTGVAGYMGAEYGIVGILVTIVIATIFIGPYLLGLYFGLTRWPILKLMLGILH